jgi:ribosomal protein S18 acetylase RimI-like enzyme
MLQLVEVKDQKELDYIRELFTEYSLWIESLGGSLDFQGFNEELAGLPGKYGGPEGALILVYCDGQAAGCGAIRKIKPGVCELKRIYTRPGFRRLGVAREASIALIEKARQAGYDFMWLDTAKEWTGPVALYRSLGFREIEPYYDSPYADLSYFMELNLNK